MYRSCQGKTACVSVQSEQRQCLARSLSVSSKIWRQAWHCMGQGHVDLASFDPCLYH